MLVAKLMEASLVMPYMPTIITQLIQQILIELAHYNAPRLVQVLCPYASYLWNPNSNNNNDIRDITTTSSLLVECSHVRLPAMNIICASIRFLSSAQLIQLLSAIVPSILPSLGSTLADLRKAVIFILVEIYLTVGEALLPYIQSLTPPQRKLLTIYIEKKMAQRHKTTTAAIIT